MTWISSGIGWVGIPEISRRDVGAVVSAGGIPADGDGLAGELEREDALDGAGCTSSNTYAL